MHMGIVFMSVVMSMVSMSNCRPNYLDRISLSIVGSRKVSNARAIKSCAEKNTVSVHSGDIEPGNPDSGQFLLAHYPFFDARYEAIYKTMNKKLNPIFFLPCTEYLKDPYSEGAQGYFSIYNKVGTKKSFSQIVSPETLTHMDIDVLTTTYADAVNEMHKNNICHGNIEYESLYVAKDKEYRFVLMYPLYPTLTCTENAKLKDLMDLKEVLTTYFTIE